MDEQARPDGWSRRMHERAAEVLRARGEAGGLAAAIDTLYDEQKRDWEELRASLAAFEKARLRSVRVDRREVWLQYNPARLANATAMVSPEAVRRRPCFLCPENMPAGQRAFPFGQGLAVVCNPFPIFHRHLVVLSTEHRPQSVRGGLGPLLDFTRWSGFSTLYNGPRSGASAPDHFHFQAAPAGSMPVEEEARGLDPRREGIFFRPGLPRRIYLLGGSREIIIELFEQVGEALEALTGADEPEINLAVTPREGGWPAVALHPRGKHRPDCYYREEPEKLMVSPGACDMAGLVILPRLQDFERLSGETMEEIYREVCLPEEAFSGLVQNLGAEPL